MLLGLVAMTQTGLLGQYAQTFLCTMGIYMILAASLNLVNGYMGEFSCGHAGFMAVGAYVSSLLSVALFTKSQVFGEPLIGPSAAVWLFPLVLIAVTALLAVKVLGFVMGVEPFAVGPFNAHDTAAHARPCEIINKVGHVTVAGVDGRRVIAD